MDRQPGNKLFDIDIPVRWGDMDPLGHVNNIMYFGGVRINSEETGARVMTRTDQGGNQNHG